jgi:hypothetical protein
VQLTVLTVSLAYFTYDSICCELISHDLPNLLHHLATILGLWVGVMQLRSGPELTVCLVLMVSANACGLLNDLSTTCVLLHVPLPLLVIGIALCRRCPVPVSTTGQC